MCSISMAPSVMDDATQMTDYGIGVASRKKSWVKLAGRIIEVVVELPGTFVHVTGGAISGVAWRVAPKPIGQRATTSVPD